VFKVTTDGSPNSDYYAYLQGIQTFSNPEAVDINLFATPGIDWSNHGSLVSNAIDMVENDRADSLYVINAPGPEYITTADDIASELDNMSIDSNYSATYWPWVQIKDTDNSTQLYIPPTGEVLKNIALTDNVAYPWFAPAGYSRGLVNAIKATKKLTLDERDELYKNRINPIATFADTGTIIWGNKTLQVKESALDRINVRRLLLRARKLISAVAVRLLFEQNDEQVRNEFLRLVNPILDSIKKERGLNEFKVTVSNDPEDIDANTLRGKIYIKPTRALEFIDLEFIITPTGASFENI
jgi:phage tail sheath protein FI